MLLVYDYNEYSDEARYGVMRSAKRTQTYWRAGCAAPRAERGRRAAGHAIGPPGHASDDVGAAAAPPPPRHHRQQLSTTIIHYAPITLKTYQFRFTLTYEYNLKTTLASLFRRTYLLQLLQIVSINNVCCFTLNSSFHLHLQIHFTLILFLYSSHNHAKNI